MSKSSEYRVDVITTPVSMDPPPPPPPTVVATNNMPKPPKLKSIGDAYVLGLPLGFLGIHHFYLGSVSMGLAYLFTAGCGGIGWLVDWFRMPMLVKDANRKIERKWQMKNEDPGCRDDDDVSRYELDTKRLSDCYVLGFVTGFLGFHQFYLRRYGWGMIYLFSVGMCGIGVILDWFRMPVLFKRYKMKLKLKSEGKDEGLPEERYLDDAYLCCFPLGLIGLHHFYLRRPCWGLLYLFTCGLFGIGFLIDMCRMKSLVDDANRRAKAKIERQKLITGSNTVAGVSYSTNPNTVNYNTPMSYGQPGASGAGQSTYQCPYPSEMPSSEHYASHPGGYHPPPPPAASNPESAHGIAPPPYTPVADTASAMPPLHDDDEDGINVKKTGMSGVQDAVATDTTSDIKKDLP